MYLGWEIALVYGIYGRFSVGISISIGIEDWVARDAGTRYEVRHSIIRVNSEAIAFTYIDVLVQFEVLFNSERSGSSLLLQFAEYLALLESKAEELDKS